MQVRSSVATACKYGIADLGAEWWNWVGGFLYLVWAIFGPYITLYLSTAMFYWWSLARVGRPFWIAATDLFVVGSIVNVRSH